MRNCYCWLAGLLLAVGPAAAQAPAGPLHPAQTITLGARAMVAGTVALPNHNLVLLLTDAETNDLVAQCLAPDGHTLWKTTLTRYGRHSPGYTVEAQRHIAFSREARENKQREKDKAAAELFPIDVISSGNEIITAEHINKETAKRRENEGQGLEAGQVYVQRLDEQGHLTKQLFKPVFEVESKKTEVAVLGRYADAGGYSEVVRAVNSREETMAYYLMHFDLKTKDVRRELIEMPATLKEPGGKYRHWYLDWAYLGHRPGQTYFGRRSLLATEKDKAGKQPLRYQVFIADDHGAPASPSGFTTTLDLGKDTRVAYSGRMFSPDELNHIPKYYTVSQGKYYVTYDEWEVGTGGLASFYLDHATGDVLIYGEYTEGVLPSEVGGSDDLQGLFMRRYAPDGKVLAQSQTEYSEEMRAKRQKLSFRSHIYRTTGFHADPLTGDYHYRFSPLKRYGRDAFFSVVMDHDLRYQRFTCQDGSDKDREKITFTTVTFVQPFELSTANDSEHDFWTYEHADAKDLPVYAALEQQRRAAPLEKDDYNFYLSSTGAGKGLVVEQPDGLGGSLKVYTF